MLPPHDTAQLHHRIDEIKGEYSDNHVQYIALQEAIQRIQEWRYIRTTHVIRYRLLP